MSSNNDASNIKDQDFVLKNNETNKNLVPINISNKEDPIKSLYMARSGIKWTKLERESFGSARVAMS